MSVAAVVLEAHVVVPPVAIVAPRVVVSRLGRGETLMTGVAASLKLLLEGEEIYRIDGRTYRLVPGRALVIDRGASYEATVRGERTKGLCVYLPGGPQSTGEPGEPLLGRTAVRALPGLQGGAELLAAAAAVHSDTALLEDMAPRIARFAAMALSGARSDAAEQLRRLDLKRPSTRQEVINRLEIARAHLHATIDRQVRLEELADLAGLSAFHLARYFTAAFGAPPARYHRSLRLQHAARLLRSEGASATEAAERIGYSELAAFSHAFRREFGHPPSRE